MAASTCEVCPNRRHGHTPLSKQNSLIHFSSKIARTPTALERQYNLRVFSSQRCRRARSASKGELNVKRDTAAPIPAPAENIHQPLAGLEETDYSKRATSRTIDCSIGSFP